MLENRIARYLATESPASNSAVKTIARPKQPAARTPWQVMTQADMYRLAFEQAREEAQRKHWSNNRIRRYFE